MIQRSPHNPIIRIDDLKPSAEGLQVIGVFNPGACRLGDETILLVRVAESCVPENNWIKIPMMKYERGKFQLNILSYETDGNLSIAVTDPRVITINGKQFLSSLSHLRVARSRDGVHFTISDTPFLFPEKKEETFGVEDCRITQIDKTYYITYTAVSEDGFGVALASTEDFSHVRRLGMVFPPLNKDACVFPEKVGQHFIALHRPQVNEFGKPSIWLAQSLDLIHWGNHSCLLRPRNNQWEIMKIGAGPQPIKTPQGWLLLYHGCDQNSVYTLHLCLLELENPRRILKQTTSPILIPEDEWEKNGFFTLSF